MIDKKRIYDNLKKLVAVPGISGTESETETAAKLVELLSEIPYFKENSQYITVVPLMNDPFKRTVVTALYQSAEKTDKTIILTGHYDVVDVEEYGHRKDKAFDIEEMKQYIEELSLDADTLKDWKSGDWIFGRGTADMKFGLALCIELLKHFSEEKLTKGNLLFVAVPGEETNSEGMLAAVPYMNRLKKQKGLSYSALLLAECYMMEDQGKDHNRYIHIGASGKVMPMFFFVGEATHAGEPFLGLDPNLMAAELYKVLHLNAEFCQASRGETTPPPVCLKQQDLKNGYSVSTPLYAAAYYNLITVSLNPDELMQRLYECAETAFQNACDFMDKRALQFHEVTGETAVRSEYEPYVITFSDLYAEVKSTVANLDSRIHALVKGLMEAQAELQQISISIVKEVYALYPKKRPMIILSIIPPYYPDVYPDLQDGKVNDLLEGVKEIIAYAEAQYGETLELKNYYMGISDMCYTGLPKGRNFDQLLGSMVGIGESYHFPQADMKEFDVPGIVLGGFGKDFHKHTERLNYSYNFNVLPDLYEKLIISLFHKN